MASAAASQSTPAPAPARPLVIIAAACIVAAVLTTIASTPLTARLGFAGIGLALAVMWVIAITGTAAWLRFASAGELGLKRVGIRDAVIAILAGLLLSVTVPLLSLGAAALTGYSTGTIETAAQLNVAVAAAGVITAAFAEEIIYRAITMGHSSLYGHPPWWCC